MKFGMGPCYFSRYGEDGGKRLYSQGYRYLDVDWYANTEGELYEGEGEDFIRNCERWRDYFTRDGLIIHQIHGPWRYPVRDGTAEDRKERFEKMSKALLAASILGAKYMAIHPIMPEGANSPENPEEQFRMNVEFYSELTKVAERYGVIICLENMPFLELPTAPVEAILRIVKEINHPNFRMCLDTGHANIFKAPTVADAVRIIGKEYLATLHVHDNLADGDTHLMPFDGTVDWADFTKALKEIGFDGVVNLETVPKPFKEGEDNEAAELELLRRIKIIADAI